MVLILEGQAVVLIVVVVTVVVTEAVVAPNVCLLSVDDEILLL